MVVIEVIVVIELSVEVVVKPSPAEVLNGRQAAHRFWRPSLSAVIKHIVFPFNSMHLPSPTSSGSCQKGLTSSGER